MRANERFASGVLAVVAFGARLLAGQDLDRRQLQQLARTLEHEGQAVIALADAAARGDAVPSDFSITWHNDFLKAQTGAFVPFVVNIAAPAGRTPAVLLYLRVSRRDRPPRAEAAAYPFEEVYPVESSPDGSSSTRFSQGFPLQPGAYDLTVVARERERDGDRGGRRLAAVQRQPLTVPDFAGTELMISTVIVADRLTVLPPGGERDLPGRPYVIAGRDIQPAPDRLFRRDEELIVVFLVYNPAVTQDKQFDLEVEYHFFRKHGSEESYVNRTESQRFNRSSLGPHYDPAAGQPVMAGQGVPLAGFEDGDYRLRIDVRDLVAGRTISRDVSFTVGP